MKGLIDDESIDYVEGIQCHINLVQFELESFGGDGGPRFHINFDKNYDRYESNLCFEGLCEAEQGWIYIRFIVKMVELPRCVLQKGVLFHWKARAQL